MYQQFKKRPFETPLRIFAVIVMYKVHPLESSSYKTLCAAIANCIGGVEFKILIYDNTPGGQDPGVLPTEVRYHADPENSGLASAYNSALEIAESEGYDWMLTLDQDSHLPLDFIGKLSDAIALVENSREVAGVVPFIEDGGKIISPVYRRKTVPLFKDFPFGFAGVSFEQTYAINSVSTLRVSALRAIGGYDPRFALDQSDMVLYRKLYCNQLHIFVAGNILVQHEASIFDLKNRSTLKRYEGVLRAEEAFYDEYLDWDDRLSLLLRLFHLVVYRLFRTNGSLSHFKLAARFFLRRIFYSRKRRAAAWKQLAGPPPQR